eukprot:TRINITY_DN1661_c1_g1_i3.p1 TRINITY_DN1661_c1_g1~~TRINITY_DN1661_c1_g1_i3.p1  ORF type:complete len:125 (+),score=49.72 TRINITY_DN1661_c1_g1_i3:423-797(+)
MGLFTGLIGKYPAEFLCKATLLLCGWKSFKAIESAGSADDTQWLTFWTVISAMQFGEFWLDLFRNMLPYYNEGKFVALVWLGFFRGANTCYKMIRPYMKQYEGDVDKVLEEAKAKAEGAAKGKF